MHIKLIANRDRIIHVFTSGACIAQCTTDRIVGPTNGVRFLALKI